MSFGDALVLWPVAVKVTHIQASSMLLSHLTHSHIPHLESENRCAKKEKCSIGAADISLQNVVFFSGKIESISFKVYAIYTSFS